MSPAPKNRLFDLMIDEVSVVDRPANQHGLIAFAKADDAGGDPTQEGTMPDEIFDAEGAGVDPEDLEHGDVVYDDEGNEYVFVLEEEDDADDEDGGELEDELSDDLEDEPQLVGKFDVGDMIRAGKAGWKTGKNSMFNSRSNKAAWNSAAHVSRNKKKYGVGAATAGTAATAGGAYGMAKKSLGDEVLEELSKAVGDADRDEVIAKAMDVVEVYKAQTEAMAEQMAAMEDERVEEAFISKAAEYNLPVSPAVLGPILKAASTVLTEEQLDVLDELFTAVGDTLYDEIGYVGDTDNVSVMDQVNAVASDLVGKADLTSAEAFVAAFEANPAAYDAYLAEQNGR